MSFEKHLFISYAHIDNEPLTPEQEGWISRFHASLQTFLNMRMGRRAEIWRDDRLRGNEVFADEIVEQFSQTALLVSILTPRYLNSEWCTREAHEFCNSAQQSGGLVVDNKARVFKVIKTPVETEETLPAVMKDVLGYEFFTYEDGAPLELDPQENAQDYKRKVNKLAWDIAQLIKSLEADATGDQEEPGQEQKPDKPIVYLAECSYDRKEDREILEGELRRHGYTVLPDQPLPREEQDYVAAVKGLLERCQFSIHLVGEAYGAVPDGPTSKSVPVLQNELAIQRSKSDALPRLIWLPEGTRSEQTQQQEFITALHEDAEVQFGADLITGDLGELRTSIHNTLKKLTEPERKIDEPEEQAAAEGMTKLIYLICIEKDRKATVPLRKYFKQQSFDVSLPAFEGDSTEVREANRRLLTTCDAVIVFYGAGGEAWKRTVDNELKKMPGYRGGKPLLAKYTYLSEPRTSDKEDLVDMEEPNLIDGLDGFDEDMMTALLQAVNESGAAS